MTFVLAILAKLGANPVEHQQAGRHGEQANADAYRYCLTQLKNFADRPKTG